MEQANVRLSAEELALAADPQVMFTKAAVVAKVYRLFGALAQEQLPLLARLHHEMPAQRGLPAKISRGENYLGLPYVMLDHPRHFRDDEVLAVRTLFWWGKFFSVTLHLKGTARERLAARILGRRRLLCDQGFLVCVGDDEWQHHAEADNYLSCAGMPDGRLVEALAKGPFLKLCRVFPIEDLEVTGERLSQAFSGIMELLRGEG